jgi:hypothetical protein
MTPVRKALTALGVSTVVVLSGIGGAVAAHAQTSSTTDTTAPANQDSDTGSDSGSGSQRPDCPKDNNADSAS